MSCWRRSIRPPSSASWSASTLFGVRSITLGVTVADRSKGRGSPRTPGSMDVFLSELPLVPDLAGIEDRRRGDVDDVSDRRELVGEEGEELPLGQEDRFTDDVEGSGAHP